MRAPRHVEIDPCRRDRAREHVERHVADDARVADVTLKVAPAEREVDRGRRPARLADHRRRPLPPELVAVAVEEDVHLLLDRLRREELRVRAPEHRLRAAGAELEQARQPALRVREHEVVLRRVGTVVVVEAGVHAAELRQAHRHVAVVEDDGDPEPLAQGRRNPAEVGHRHGEEDDRIGPLPLDEPLEMPPPARRDDAPDRLAGEPVERRLLRLVLGTSQIPVALEARQPVAQGGVRLALAVGRVRRRPPPGRLDRAAPVRRHDEIDAGLVHPFPELPPRRRAAVAEVEVDGGRNGQDLRGLHRGKSREGDPCGRPRTAARRVEHEGSASTARNGVKRPAVPLRTLLLCRACGDRSRTPPHARHHRGVHRGGVPPRQRRSDASRGVRRARRGDDRADDGPVCLQAVTRRAGGRRSRPARRPRSRSGGIAAARALRSIALGRPSGTSPEIRSSHCFWQSSPSR